MVDKLEEAELALLSPVAPDDLVALEPEEAAEAAAAAGPTMMSKEARDLFLNGGGASALQAWKVCVGGGGRGGRLGVGRQGGLLECVLVAWQLLKGVAPGGVMAAGTVRCVCHTTSLSLYLSTPVSPPNPLNNPQERWYKVKMGYPDAGPNSTRQVVGAYLTGLHWVLQYYYRGVASWDWFYPHHYAPMASDLVNLETYQGGGGGEGVGAGQGGWRQQGQPGDVPRCGGREGAGRGRGLPGWGEGGGGQQGV